MGLDADGVFSAHLPDGSIKHMWFTGFLADDGHKFMHNSEDPFHSTTCYNFIAGPAKKRLERRILDEAASLLGLSSAKELRMAVDMFQRKNYEEYTS